GCSGCVAYRSVLSMSQSFLGILLALVPWFAPAASGVAPQPAPERGVGQSHARKSLSPSAQESLASGSAALERRLSPLQDAAQARHSRWQVAPAGSKGKASVAESPSAAPKAAHPLAIDVRGAVLGTVVAQMGSASESALRTAVDLADERVTLFAPRTDVEEFRNAVATLLGHRWRSTGTPPPSLRWVLERDPAFEGRRTALQQRRKARFLRRVLETANAIAGRGENETLEQVKTTFQKRHPEFDAETLKDLNAGFLRQSLVALPL